MMASQDFSKYERARIIGARALQISMDAPLLMDFQTEDLEGINFDPLKIAEKELDGGVLPISIKRPLPLVSGQDISKVTIEESGITDEEKIKAEREEEKEIAEGGEMMELTNTDEESEDTSHFQDSDASERA